jgi:hypothetical protein
LVLSNHSLGFPDSDFLSIKSITPHRGAQSPPEMAGFVVLSYFTNTIRKADHPANRHKKGVPKDSFD